MTTSRTDRIAGVIGQPGFKTPCAAASTAALTLSGEQTVDGVAVVDGDRVLVKDQASGVDNGIYVVSTSAWARAKDMDGKHDVVRGALVHVVAGDTNSGFWYVTTSGTIVVGTTSLAFARASTELATVSAYAQTLLDDTTATQAQATLEIADDEGWVQGTTPTYVSASSFTVAGDLTGTYTVGRRVRIVDSGGTKYGTIATSAYTSLTTITLDANSDSLASPTSSLAYGIINFSIASSSLSILDEDDMASDSAVALPTQQSIKAYVGGVLTSEVATTSGTSVEIVTGIAGCKEVFVHLNGVSLSGSEDMYVKVGTTGGVGGTYSGMALRSTSGPTLNQNSMSLGIRFLSGGASSVWTGTVHLVLQDAANNTWFATYLADNNSNELYWGSAQVALTGALDGVWVYNTTSDTFDAGTVCVTHR